MTPSDLDPVLDWCSELLGPARVLADDTREHPGLRAGAIRLQTLDGEVYLKLHRDPLHWASEVHAYRHWTASFGEKAPRLLAVRETAPLALVISALPGKILDATPLPAEQERAVWRSAGQALAVMHDQPPGNFFGQCRADGSPAGPCISDPRSYLGALFDDLLERGGKLDCLTGEERAIAAAARGLIPAFTGERPTACHRDYGPANWLVTEAGGWSGVIDFEFAYWDVRAVDLARYPNWEWIRRPDLIESFMAGYGKPTAEEQLWCARALYALGVIVWSLENEYFIFAQEGRAALQEIGQRIA